MAISWLAVYASPVQAVEGLNDKSKHVLAFAVLAFGLARYWRWAPVWVVLVLFAYGVGIEWVQHHVPGRTASAWDVLADCVGIVVGLVAAHMWGRRAQPG